MTFFPSAEILHEHTGVGAVYAAGSTFAVGAGVMVCVGCSFYDPLLAITEVGAGAGLSFVGAGEVVFVGCPSILTTIVKAVVSDWHASQLAFSTHCAKLYF